MPANPKCPSTFEFYAVALPAAGLIGALAAVVLRWL